MFGARQRCKRSIFVGVLAASLSAAVGSVSRAATITTSPEDTTTQGNFVTAGYATDGYALFNTDPTSDRTGYGYLGDPLTNSVGGSHTLLEQPSSVGISINSSSTNEVNYDGYGYSSIQDPADPSSQVQAGLAGNDNSSGTYNLFVLSVGSGFPASGVQVAVIQTPGYAYSLTLAQTAGSGTPSQTIVESNSGAFDYYFFDISGAQNGDQFTLSATATSSGSHAMISGLAFSAVPEPASLAIMGLGAMGLLARRRRA